MADTKEKMTKEEKKRLKKEQKKAEKQKRKEEKKRIKKEKKKAEKKEAKRQAKLAEKAKKKQESIEENKDKDNVTIQESEDSARPQTQTPDQNESMKEEQKSTEMCKDENDTNAETDADSDTIKRKLETNENDINDEPPLKKRKLSQKINQIKQEMKTKMMMEDTKEENDNQNNNDDDNSDDDDDDDDEDEDNDIDVNDDDQNKDTYENKNSSKHNSNSNQIEGKLVRWNNAKGFGFIEYKDSKSNKNTEIFVHCNDIYLEDCEEGDKSMKVNQKVLFEVGEDPKIRNKRTAVNVTGLDGGPCKRLEYVNNNGEPLTGVIVRWNDDKGFGFAKIHNNMQKEFNVKCDEVFVHWNSIKGSKGFSNTWLEKDEEIEFDLVDDPFKEGSFKAINITGLNGNNLKCGIRGSSRRSGNSNSYDNGNYGSGSKGGGYGKFGKNNSNGYGNNNNNNTSDKFDAFFDKKATDKTADNKKEETEEEPTTFTEGKSVGEVLSWNDKGFGFIKPNDGGDDVFVHASDLYYDDSAGRGIQLRIGQTVEYNISYKDGKTRASDVTGPNGAPCKGIEYVNKEGKITGHCSKWNDDAGYGFVTPDDKDLYSEDAFVHWRNIEGTRGFDNSWLKVGENVEFDLKVNPKNGKIEATNVNAPKGGQRLECQQNSY